MTKLLRIIEPGAKLCAACVTGPGTVILADNVTLLCAACYLERLRPTT